MTTTQEALKMAQEVPLIERLRNVPENARLIVDSADGMSSSVHAIGYLCHEAAKALEQPLTRDWKETVNERKAKDIEFAKALEQEQEPLYFGLTHDHTWLSISKTAYDVLEPEGRMALYTHPAKQLSDDEIASCTADGLTDEYDLKFARAIEAKIRGE